MNQKETLSHPERLKKLLSFAVAAMNATNVLMPVAIPYVHIAKTVQQDIAQTGLPQASVEAMHLGAQLLDRAIFSKAEAVTRLVKDGEVVQYETVYADWQTILSGGMAMYGVIGEDGYQYISVGGVALSTTVKVNGWQAIYNGGTALQTTISNGGWQTIDNGGTALQTTISSGGRQDVSSGGISLDISQAVGGAISSYVYGSDSKTSVTGRNEKGSFSLANGTAGNFVIYSGGFQVIGSGGTALQTTISSGGSHLLYNGGTALQTTISSGGSHLVYNGGTSLDISQAVGAIISSYVYGSDSQTSVTGRNEKGSFSLANGTASNFVIYSGGSQVVYSGGTALQTTISRGGSHQVNNGGTALQTTISSGGFQWVYNGGTSLDISQSVGGNIQVYVYGSDSKTSVTGRNEKGSFSLANGTASNFIIYRGGSQQVVSGGTALNTTISSGGSHQINNRATALQTTISSGGLQLVVSGGTSLDINQAVGGNIQAYVYGSDSKTSVTGRNEKGSFSLANGTAGNFIIYRGGSQIIYDGGTALQTTISSGGVLDMWRGTSLDISQAVGGNILAYVFGSDSKTSVTGTNEKGSFLLANGTASNFIIYSGGTQNIHDGGTALQTTISSGGTHQVYSGGTSLDISQAVGGNIRSYVYGSDSKTSVTGRNEKGSFSLVNGTASNFVIYRGGLQEIDSGGIALNTNINGGYQKVINGAIAQNTIVNSGDQDIGNSGVAVSTTINAGGWQYVLYDGIAASTTINADGTQLVDDGGSATDTVVNSGGTMLLFSGAVIDNVKNSGVIDVSNFNNGTINSLNGANGEVLFNADPYTPVIYTKVLNLGSISGSQTFDIAVDLKNNVADNLVIAGDASGTHYIKVTKEARPGSALSGLTGPATVATVLGVDTSEFLGAQSAIDGVKLLPNIVHNGNLWQIDSYSIIGVSDLSKVAAVASDMGYAALYSGDGTLKMRMYDLRNSVKDAGVWAKLSGGELAADSNTLKHATFQGGYDKVHNGANGTTVTGIMIEHLDGSTAYTANGSGKLKNTRLGLYHTWFGNSGQYYDLVLKTGSLRNEFKVYESQTVQGNYSTWNTMLSMEYGYKKQLKDGLYINPLFKLSFGRINGASYTTDSDTSIQQDGVSSVLGRLGIGIGQNTERSKWYFSAAILHELSAKSRVTTGQGAFASTIENSLKGTALEVALGTSINLSKAGVLYADIAKSFGGKVVNKWQLQTGYRLNF